MLAPNCTFHDASKYGTGIFRAASMYVNNGWYLHYQYVPAPNELTNPLSDNWPAWVNTSIQLDPRSGLAVEDAYVFYRGLGGGVYRGQLNGSTITPTLLYNTTNSPCSFAPVSPGEVYVQWKTAPDARFSKIGLYNTVSQAMTEWPGRIYGPQAILPTFDAVRLNGRDRIYFADETGKRTLYLTRKASVWSDVRQLIPLDVVDDTSSFTIGGASVIDGKIFLAGVLKRDKNFPMHIFSYEVT